MAARDPTRYTRTMIDPAIKAKILEDLEHLPPDLQQRAQEFVHELVTVSQPPPKLRNIPWAGLVHDSEMVAGGQIEDELGRGWADAIDRDRG